MYWLVTPDYKNGADCWVGPAETEAEHSSAIEYAMEQLEEQWNQLNAGMAASVTIECCMGDMPPIDCD